MQKLPKLTLNCLILFLKRNEHFLNLKNLWNPVEEEMSTKNTPPWNKKKNRIILAEEQIIAFTNFLSQNKA